MSKTSEDIREILPKQNLNIDDIMKVLDDIDQDMDIKVDKCSLCVVFFFFLLTFRKLK